VSSVVVSQDTLATRCEGAVLLWNTTSKGGNSGSCGSVDGGGGSGSGASGSGASGATKAEAEVEAEVEGLAAAAPESRQQFFDGVGPSTAPYLNLALELCAAICVLWHPSRSLPTFARSPPNPPTRARQQTQQLFGPTFEQEQEEFRKRQKMP